MQSLLFDFWKRDLSFCKINDIIIKNGIEVELAADFMDYGVNFRLRKAA